MSKRNKGIVCIIGAAFCFALMNLLVRLSGDLPVFQKGFFRNAVALVVSTSVLLKSKTFREDLNYLKDKENVVLLVIRAIMGTIGFLCNFYAVDRLNISDASMLNKLAPFFGIIFSAIFLKERANRIQWAAVVVAFIGSLFIIKPTMGLEVVPAVAGVMGGLGAGAAYTAVRRLGQKAVKSSFVVFFFSAFSCVILLPMIVICYMPMTWVQLLLLLSAGMAASGGQFFVTSAYMYAPAKEISVYDYSQVLFAALFGFLFLDQRPDHFSIIGYVIICAVAILMWLRRDKNAKKEKQKV